ncbi:hypothetical protein Pfo_004927 [Paulownia fortunei]|nr:hypothetical protein Pfo_004927 [Paulownia fortunei]
MGMQKVIVSRTGLSTTSSDTHPSLGRISPPHLGLRRIGVRVIGLAWWSEVSVSGELFRFSRGSLIFW